MPIVVFSASEWVDVGVEVGVIANLILEHDATEMKAEAGDIHVRRSDISHRLGILHLCQYTPV